MTVSSNAIAVKIIDDDRLFQNMSALLLLAYVVFPHASQNI